MATLPSNKHIINIISFLKIIGSILVFEMKTDVQGGSDILNIIQPVTGRMAPLVLKCISSACTLGDVLVS